MKSQVRFNLISNIISLLVNVVVGLLYTPYLVKSLGVSVYGIIPLVLIVNQYIYVITESLTGSLTRFYSVSSQNKEFDIASKYLSTSITIIICFSVIIIPFYLLLIKNLQYVFTINNENIEDAKVLFSFTLGSFILSLFSSVLNTVLYSLNRLDLINLVKIIRIGLKSLGVVIFFIAFNKSIVFIGISNLISEIIILSISIILFIRYKERKVKINLREIDKVVFKVISITTFWIILQRIGDTTLYRIDNLLVNKMYGVYYSGILGAINELSSYITNVLIVVSSIFGPLVLIQYASNKHHKLQNNVYIGTLIVGILSSIITGIVIGHADLILKLWLGPEFEKFNYWLIIKVISIPFIASSIIFSYVFRAWNYLKITAIVTLATGIINTLLIYLIVDKNNTNDISIILIICSISSVFQSFIWGAFYYTKIYKKIKYKIYIKMLVNFISIIILSVLISLLMRKIEFNSKILQLILSSLITSAITIAILYFAFSKKMQKRFLLLIRKK